MVMAAAVLMATMHFAADGEVPLAWTGKAELVVEVPDTVVKGLPCVGSLLLRPLISVAVGTEENSLADEERLVLARMRRSALPLSAFPFEHPPLAAVVDGQECQPPSREAYELNPQAQWVGIGGHRRRIIGFGEDGRGLRGAYDLIRAVACISLGTHQIAFSLHVLGPGYPVVRSRASTVVGVACPARLAALLTRHNVPTSAEDSTWLFADSLVLRVSRPAALLDSLTPSQAMQLGGFLELAHVALSADSVWDAADLSGFRKKPWLAQCFFYEAMHLAQHPLAPKAKELLLEAEPGAWPIVGRIDDGHGSVLRVRQIWEAVYARH